MGEFQGKEDIRQGVKFQEKEDEEEGPGENLNQTIEELLKLLEDQEGFLEREELLEELIVEEIREDY